jgi:hypothetical protein
MNVKIYITYHGSNTDVNIKRSKYKGNVKIENRKLEIGKYRKWKMN